MKRDTGETLWGYPVIEVGAIDSPTIEPGAVYDPRLFLRVGGQDREILHHWADHESVPIWVNVDDPFPTESVVAYSKAGMLIKGEPQAGLLNSNSNPVDIQVLGDNVVLVELSIMVRACNVDQSGTEIQYDVLPKQGRPDLVRCD